MDEGIGEIIGELKEFKRNTMSRLEGIEIEVKRLNEFKWRVAGVFSFLLVAIEVVKMYLEKQ